MSEVSWKFIIFSPFVFQFYCQSRIRNYPYITILPGLDISVSKKACPMSMFTLRDLLTCTVYIHDENSQEVPASYTFLY